MGGWGLMYLKPLNSTFKVVPKTSRLPQQQCQEEGENLFVVGGRVMFLLWDNTVGFKTYTIDSEKVSPCQPPFKTFFCWTEGSYSIWQEVKCNLSSVKCN